MTAMPLKIHEKSNAKKPRKTFVLCFAHTNLQGLKNLFDVFQENKTEIIILTNTWMFRLPRAGTRQHLQRAKNLFVSINFQCYYESTTADSNMKQ